MKIAIITGLFILLLSYLAHAAPVSGVYDMQIQIGDTTFNDEVELQTLGKIGFMSSELVGFVTVPSVFRVPLTGTMQYKPWSGLYFLNFSILNGLFTCLEISVPTIR